MERLVEDFTPAVNKLYIALNRILADRGVLPEIKAELRARSDLRPDDDRDLIATFDRLLERGARGGGHRRRADDAVRAGPRGCVQIPRRRRRCRRGDDPIAPDVSRALASPEILKGLHALAAKAANSPRTRGTAAPRAPLPPLARRRPARPRPTRPAATPRPATSPTSIR